ncbi:hypothetical protein BH23GEM9_BH23GEM9_03290 [soil metagenome]
MNRFDCDLTRDLIPLLIRGQLLPHDAAGAEQHLELCAECAAEAALVRTLAAAAPAVPGGLEARVLLAVRRPAARTWAAPSRLAMAATVAAAVLGGSVVFERWSSQTGPESGVGALVFDDNIPQVMSWSVTQDPLLHGGSTLTQLSVEELELILQELDS